MTKYCENCVMECYKAGLDVKSEFTTDNPEDCSFKDRH